MKKLASTTWGSVLLGLAISGTAVAQTAPSNNNDDGAPEETTTNDTPPPAPVYTPPPAPEPEPTVYVPPPMEEEDEGLLSGIGIAIAAGGGAGGFVDNDMSDTADIGGDWDVRATFGTRSYIAFEGSYIGSAQSIDALGLDTDAVLVGNGLQGALRVNATEDYFVQPFAFGGAAWRRYDITNADTNLSDVNGEDDVLEFPVGIGIAGRWSGLMLDARGEYRFSTDEDLMRVADEGGDFAGMDRWGVKGTVGVEF